MIDYYFKEAIEEAYKSKSNNEIPVGAIIVNKDGNIVGRGNNNREKNNKTISHAEINAILDANKNLDNWRLNDCIMYVTLEPCEMCKKVIEESRIKNVYYLSDNSKKQLRCKTKYNKYNDNNLIEKTDYLINESFKNIRSK